MIPYKIKTYLQSLLIVSFYCFVNGLDRTLYSELNPGCAKCTKSNPLMYVKAVGSTDTIHQIWDFTFGVPTVILAVTKSNTSIDIVWKETIPTEFKLPESPKYAIAAAFEKLYEYNDIEDLGHIDPSCARRAVPLSQAEWRLRRDIRKPDEAFLLVRGRLFPTPGTVDVKLNLLPFQDYAETLPHLIHSANSTLIDISLVNLTTFAEFNSSRFALRLVLVSLDSANESLRYDVRKSLDDEHTPGVFEMVEVMSPAGAAGGFLQFRPVAYTLPQRSVSDSTTASLSNLTKSWIAMDSTLQAFFGDFDSSKLLVEDTFVSMGAPSDGYYRHYNYTAWSVTIGYGAPPLESFSPFVIGLIACGLGAPIVLAVMGTAVLCCMRRRNNGRQRLLQED